MPQASEFCVWFRHRRYTDQHASRDGAGRNQLAEDERVADFEPQKLR